MSFRVGSPPRVRGKVMAHGCCVRTCRITPACAGKSRSRKCTQAEREDYPRVCGEKWSPESMRRLPWGSPPRMRGKANGLGIGIQ